MVFRRIIGKGPIAVVKRCGIWWNLDLNQSEGISIYLTGRFQGASVIALQELVHPGDTVLDIGAHFGSQTMHLAKSVGPLGKVYAFEPTCYAYQELKKNIALNPDLSPRIVAEQMMVASHSTAAVPTEVYSNWPIVTSETVHEHHRGIAMDTVGSFVDSIDGYCEKHGIQSIQIIKIDVDGFECEVLRGARQTLRKNRPPLMIELEPCLYDQPGGPKFEDLLDLLREAGYQLKHTTKKTLLPMDSSLRKLIPEGSSLDALAVPV